MKIISKIIVTLALFVMLFGCNSISSESVTDLREYSVNGYLTFVGVGVWNNDTFIITDYRGVKHEIPSNVEILEGPISLSSFDRARQRITPQVAP